MNFSIIGKINEKGYKLEVSRHDIEKTYWFQFRLVSTHFRSTFWENRIKTAATNQSAFHNFSTLSLVANPLCCARHGRAGREKSTLTTIQDQVQTAKFNLFPRIMSFQKFLGSVNRKADVNKKEKVVPESNYMGR